MPSILPHPMITPILSSPRQPAVAALWNDRYGEIDENFAALEAANVLTGYTSGAGTVAASDTVLQAIQKLNGNFDAGNNYAYGVKWDFVNDTMRGVIQVNGALLEYDYQNFPIQEQMKRCLLAHTTGAFNYYLHPNDSTKKLDGTAATLTGADGNVMVQIPKFYYALFNDGNFMYALISYGAFSYTKSNGSVVTAVVHPIFFSGGLATPVDYKYCSAYEGVLYRSSAYIHGTTTQSYLSGDKIRSVSGYLPLSTFSRTMRRQATDGAFYQYDYWMGEAIILLYLTRYKNWNSQLMLPGYTEGAPWDITKICKTGVTNVLGNNCGSVKYGVANANKCAYVQASDMVVANSFYGIENFYGHLWKWVDGVDFLFPSGVYVCNNPALFTDESVTNYSSLGITPLGTTGYQQTLFDGTFLPSSVANGSSSTFVTDYYYQPSAAGWRALSAGGALTYGARAGVAYRDAGNAAAGCDAGIAGRSAA